MDAEVYHLFEKYLNNDLTDSEKAEFEKRISDDKEFAGAFETYREIYASLEAKENRAEGEEALQQNLREISEDFFENGSEETTTKVIPMKRWIQLAAASIVIALGVTFFFNRDRSKPTYAQFAKYEALALAERGMEDSLKVLAGNYFNNKQYERAATTLEELLQREPDNTQAKLYLGIALTETDRFDQADELFKEIQTGGSIFTSKATWYLALSYLKQNETDACQSTLEEIPESAEEYDRAQKLLEELR